AEPDDEQPDDDGEVGSRTRDQQAAQDIQAERAQQRDALSPPFQQESRGNGNDAVGEEEGEGQETCQNIIELVPLNDDRDQRTNDVRDERNQKKDRHDIDDDAAVFPVHAFLL